MITAAPRTPVTVRAVDARLVRVPMRRPLHTSADRITHAPLVLIDLHTSDGIVGRAYVFCYVEAVGHAVLALAQAADQLLTERSALPAEVGDVLSARFRLVGATGPVASVLSALDTACWDALAQAAGLPLTELLGAELRAIPAYNSNGLGLLAPPDAAREAVDLMTEGLPALKLRLGRRRADDDIAVAMAVREAVGDDVAIMTDFNQALSLPEARERCRRLDGLGLAWIEEPIRHDHFEGAAALADELHTPIQLGENLAGPRAMQTALAARAGDLVMPDLDRIGGVTGWLQAAALADIAGIPMSNHLYPEVSAHLMAATPTRHWLEHVDWAAPILREPLAASNGAVRPSPHPGAGLTWDEDAVAHYRIA
jgi:mandelate racemase